MRAWEREELTLLERLRRRRRLKRLQFSLREVLAVPLLVALIAGLVAWMTRDRLPQYGVNVPVDQTPLPLPEGAKDVCYCQGARGMLACEFTIDEQGFLEWGRQQIGSQGVPPGTEFSKITGRYQIVRYTWVHSKLPGPPHATISRGYYCELYIQGIFYAYDLDEQRAYYYRY